MHVVYEPQQQSRDVMVITDNIKNIMYMDQAGKFTVVSSQDIRYIMVMYEKDGNLILVEPMKTRGSGEMCIQGIKVTKHILDSKASGGYLQAIKCNGVTYEMIPPNIHHRNAAEKEIGHIPHALKG